jgi:hypothetical protein
VEEKMKICVYPSKKECAHYGTMNMSINFEFTPEEKKNKLFWLVMWRLNRKTTGEVLLWLIMNAMSGTEIIAMTLKNFDNHFQRKE